ncbi:hypothetical protein [Streptomyces griseoluteus]|uniref:hypothetical protein n=1 Tax=Streptomyces griseoluteus TaxID=29306 RepID=UPI003F4CFF66
MAARPGRMEALRLDVTDTGAAGTAVGDVAARHGRIDFLRALIVSAADLVRCKSAALCA